MNFWAAVKARSWSGIGIADMSKYIASSAGPYAGCRPGVPPRSALVTESTLMLSCATRETSAGTTVCSSFSSGYSQKLIVCGLPSSVMVKSFAVRPSIALAALIFDDHGFDHQLRAGGEFGGTLARGLRELAVAVGSQ